MERFELFWRCLGTEVNSSSVRGSKNTLIVFSASSDLYGEAQIEIAKCLGKIFTERIWMLFIILYCCPTINHPLEISFNNDTQCCEEIACQAREEIILRKCVLFVSLWQKQK